ncbi:MAG: LamG domain-containing protein, partial [Planctomycetales bacterium]|nr:LamG domain-containing protein [Planctomycetales bacterium]
QWSIEVAADGRLSAMMFDSSDAGMLQAYSDVFVNDGNWHHFALVLDTRVASENMKLHLDGVEQTIGYDNRPAADYNVSGSAPVTIGARENAKFFNGQIDEIAIYSRELTAAEIAQQYESGGQSKYGNVVEGNVIGRNATNTANLANGTGIGINDSSNNIIGGIGAGEGNIIAGNTGDGVTVTDGTSLPGQIAYWKADGSGSDSVNGLTGALVNGATYATGKNGQAFSFDGVDDYVQVGSNTALKITDDSMSFDAWIYATGNGSHVTNGGIILNREGEYELARFADGTIRWSFENTSPGFGPWHDTGYVAPLNTWTHIAVTYNAGQVLTYANGVLVDSTTESGAIGHYAPYASYNDFRIGGRQGSSKVFAGAIDDVGVYGRALTASEIAEIYAL